MNPFPRASRSTVALNPHIFGGVVDKNELQPILSNETGNHESDIDPEIQRSESQQDQTPALDGSNAGKTSGYGRVTVRVVGFRCRPLDPDNFAGGCKDI